VVGYWSLIDIGDSLCCSIGLFSFAWTAAPASIHWSAPIICSAPFGLGESKARPGETEREMADLTRLLCPSGMVLVFLAVFVSRSRIGARRNYIVLNHSHFTSAELPDRRLPTLRRVGPGGQLSLAIAFWSRFPSVHHSNVYEPR
jgi:hypothetical protein